MTAEEARRRAEEAKRMARDTVVSEESEHLLLESMHWSNFAWALENLPPGSVSPLPGQRAN